MLAYELETRDKGEAPAEKTDAETAKVTAQAAPEVKADAKTEAKAEAAARSRSLKRPHRRPPDPPDPDQTTTPREPRVRRGVLAKVSTSKGITCNSGAILI